MHYFGRTQHTQNTQHNIIWSVIKRRKKKQCDMILHFCACGNEQTNTQSTDVVNGTPYARTTLRVRINQSRQRAKRNSDNSDITIAYILETPRATKCVRSHRLLSVESRSCISYFFISLFFFAALLFVCWWSSGGL